MFGIDDLILLILFGATAKAIHWMTQDEPNYDRHLDTGRYNLDEILRPSSLVRPYGTGSYAMNTVRRPRTYIFDRETGEIREE